MKNKLIMVGVGLLGMLVGYILLLAFFAMLNGNYKPWTWGEWPKIAFAVVSLVGSLAAGFGLVGLLIDDIEKMGVKK